MELKVYDSLRAFKELYLDYLVYPEYANKLQLLRKYERLYSEIVEDEWKEEIIPNDILFKNTQLENMQSDMHLFQIKNELQSFGSVRFNHIFSTEFLRDYGYNADEVGRDLFIATENFYKYCEELSAIGFDEFPIVESAHSIILDFIKEEIEIEKQILMRSALPNNPQIVNEPQRKMRNEAPKIKINGNTQLVGYIFNQLIEGGYMEPITTKTTGNINQTATAKMFLDHFEFTEKEDQPTPEYLKKAIFENSFSQSKADRLTIPPLKIFD